ncbi:MAG: hypothetical protein Faunusvirus12_6 [Faunusvirus sp.]|jgi:hypothetical protein|uniref:Uncharacterized protein n=1 Tax=Faunusvirus sp. TaxID=2487766 RepID=A0A3G5A0N5_9VIRU|nr:MAG: hypothetical protein Faunusvirus12_6 [Faunusvirus sp.]
MNNTMNNVMNNIKKVKYIDNFTAKNLDTAQSLKRGIDDALNISGYISNDKHNYPGNIDTDTLLREPGLLLEDTPAEQVDMKYNKYNAVKGLGHLGRTRDVDSVYYLPTPIKQGRGDGNMDVNNYVSIAEGTRLLNGESISNIDQNRLYVLDRNYQDPKHIVLPFARGGIDTRHIDKYSRKNTDKAMCK